MGLYINQEEKKGKKSAIVTAPYSLQKYLVLSKSGTIIIGWIDKNDFEKYAPYLEPFVDSGWIKKRSYPEGSNFDLHLNDDELIFDCIYEKNRFVVNHAFPIRTIGLHKIKRVRLRLTINKN